MTYVVASKKSTFNGRDFWTDQLYETANQSEMIDLLSRYDDVRSISATEAHRWVRDGGVHNTGLYMDDGRIRKAKAE